MNRFSGLRRYLRLPATDRTVTSDVEDELAFHIEERTRELMSGGADRERARTLALREFGDVAAARAELEVIAKRRVRRSRRASWWSDLRQDVRFGVRAAVRQPLFSFFAIVTLALGIGANAAVFGVVKSVLLDRLPYADADRLVRVYGHFVTGSNVRGSLSAGTIRDIEDRQRSFESLAAFQSYVPDVVVGGEQGPRLGKAAWVSEGFFHTLGVRAVRGRTFQPGDARPDTALAVVLTHEAWQRHYGADPGIVGREVWINSVGPVALAGLVADRLAIRRLPVFLLTAFGVLALVLASIGVYAMFATMVVSRTREFGIRIALGSSRGAIARLVVGRGVGWMSAGLATGVLGTVLVTRLLQDLLYGTGTYDPIALATPVAVLVLSAGVALASPTYRATRAEPAAVLRVD